MDTDDVETSADVADALGEQVDDLCRFSGQATRIIVNLYGDGGAFIAWPERTENRCRSTTTDREHLNGGGADGC